jgi:hypothetical protein
LLEALDPDEHAMVEAQLARDPQLKDELALVARGLHPLAADKEHYHPPAGLAHRTCAFVAQQARAALAPPAAPVLPGRWSLVDMVVAAGIFLAASFLFFPAVNQSQFTARVLGCQNNLRQIGTGMLSYAETSDGYFPLIPFEGNLKTTPSLIEHGIAGGSQLLICPGSQLADLAGQYRPLTRDEIRRVQALRPCHVHEQLAGSYGYTWGHFDEGRYKPTRNRHRASFALVADAPGLAAPYHSSNHGGCGQNVLFEDGHVQYLTTCRARGCRDEIFTNDDGEVAPGLHPDDAVIGPNSFKLLVPVGFQVVIELTPSR